MILKLPILRTLLQVLLPLFFAGLILWPGLKGPLIYDDFYNLSPLMAENVDYKKTILENNAGPLGRVLTMTTFVVNHWLSDGLFPFELKTTNLFIHLINAVLVFFLIQMLLKIKLSSDKAALYATLVMCFWLLNPVNTGVVFYVIQRASLLAALFMLISIIAYVIYRTTQKNKYILLSLCFFSWVMGVASKENALLLPLILACIEVCFFDYLNINKINKKSLILALLSMLSIFLVAILLINKLNLLDYTNRGFTLTERLYTQPVVLLIYLKELLVPQVVDVSLYLSDFKIRQTFWNRDTLLCSLVLIILLSLAVLNLRDKSSKYISAGILIFFAGHLLESSIFPLELFFRHRNYFPSIGIYLSLILVLDRWVNTYEAKRLLIIISVIYLALLTRFSYEQAKVWSTNESIIINSYENHPESIGINLKLVGELVKQKDLSVSLSVNNAIITARPVISLPAKIQRFYIYCELADDIPDVEYELLNNDLNLIRPQLISTALHNFLLSYVNRQCDFIDVGRIIESFTFWIDEQLSSGSQSINDLWIIDYYMIELMMFSGFREQAMKRLDLHIFHGNIKAKLAKEAYQKLM